MLDFGLSLRRTDEKRLRIATSCTRQGARARVRAHPAWMGDGGRECAVRRSLGATCALPAGRRRAGAARASGRVRRWRVPVSHADHHRRCARSSAQWTERQRLPRPIAEPAARGNGGRKLQPQQWCKQYGTGLAPHDTAGTARTLVSVVALNIEMPAKPAYTRSCADTRDSSQPRRAIGMPR